MNAGDLDARRKRLHFRAWRRGLSELDLIIGRFADAEIAALSSSDLDRFETLLEVPDQLLLAWIIGAEPAPAPYRSPLLDRIAAFSQTLPPWPPPTPP